MGQTIANRLSGKVDTFPHGNWQSPDHADRRLSFSSLRALEAREPVTMWTSGTRIE
jgi:hypothetical protein